jgi:hypothetical protein
LARVAWIRGKDIPRQGSGKPLIRQTALIGVLYWRTLTSIRTCSRRILAQRALAAGVSEMLMKPLQSRDIAAALARVLHAAQ